MKRTGSKPWILIQYDCEKVFVVKYAVELYWPSMNRFLFILRMGIPLLPLMHQTFLCLKVV